MKSQNYLIVIIFFFNALVSCNADNNKNKKHQFKINLENLTVSGVSSGGYMATQYHVAHSSTINGAAILAAGPYWCARNSISRALGPCMKGGAIDPNLINDYVQESQTSGLIDHTSNLKDDKIWVFRGSKDIVMAQSVSDAIVDFYKNYSTEKNVKNVFNIAANHSMPTLSTGGDCESIGENFLNSCNYDAAGEILKTFYGDLKQRTKAIGTLSKVDQSEYSEAQFTKSGYIYIPSQCQDNKTCELHTVFHGCMQSSEVIQDKFVKGAGYNEWAESNNIVVFYPQIKSSSFSPMNPKGCWDWWGYTNENYANKKGSQINAIHEMIGKISGAIE